jgi:hypothetical protein
MNPSQLAGTVIIGAGIVMAVVGLVLVAVLDPIVGAVLFLVGVSDVAVGSMFRTGRLGGGRAAASAEAERGAAAEQAEADREANAAALGTTADGAPISGDANPYARED